MAGLAGAKSFGFPMTQGEMADALGISVVHVNRVLQHLRRDGLVALGRGTLLIRDWNGLARAADFDPAYLKSVALSS
jgi:CRP-like cAMP-binding protein